MLLNEIAKVLPFKRPEPKPTAQGLDVSELTRDVDRAFQQQAEAEQIAARLVADHRKNSPANKPSYRLELGPVMKEYTEGVDPLQAAMLQAATYDELSDEKDLADVAVQFIHKHIKDIIEVLEQEVKSIRTDLRERFVRLTDKVPAPSYVWKAYMTYVHERMRLLEAYKKLKRELR